MNNNLLVIIIFILILLILINKDKLKNKFTHINETGITNESTDNEDYNLLETNEGSDISDAETDDTDMDEPDITEAPPKIDPLDKYSKLLRSFSEGTNTESGVGKEHDLHTDNCVVCMNDLNDSMCIKNRFHSKWEEKDFSKTSPSFKKWEDAEEKSNNDILTQPAPAGFGGYTDRVNRRFNKTIEYMNKPYEYAPDTLVRDDRYPPHLVPGLLKNSDYSLV